MSVASDSFVKGMGKPDPATASGLRLTHYQSVWDRLHREIGAGWFRGGFLYLFGEGLDALRACVDAWSFVAPPCADRTILGRNAYGAILVLEDADTPERERVCVLDPFTVTYATVPDTTFVSLIARALPSGELRTFLDDRAYRAWLEENQVDRLDLDDVLGIKVPRGLGGELTASNLQLDGIVSYYQTTAPIYARAFAALASKGT